MLRPEWRFVFRSLHGGHDVGDRIGARDEIRLGVRDGRDERHAFRDERQERRVRVSQDVQLGGEERRRQLGLDRGIREDRVARRRQEGARCGRIATAGRIFSRSELSP